MATLKQLAFRMARTPASGSLVRFGFAHADRLLPLTAVERGGLATIYRHPRPCYGTFHHIAVPLRGVPDIFALAHPRHAELRDSLFALIASARQRTPSAVLVNAGPRQDVGQVHFHLTDGAPYPEAVRSERLTWPGWDEALRALTSVPDIQERYRSGFSLLQDAAGPQVRLI
ncbi:hypothetical protein HPC49_07675 [Pyxidicoccus fallax]|uniref:Homoserine O-succinyltransferase n=1 Tax=Pyxidicoccus fallax TaxID=394095 RepID=A0A848LCY6_9BACT|nr:hypothetical protein [Pyxidicoccus fallax]NMO16547.1 homoserine O-succinyltransferase [Pyxidicoccus fallax]NPC78132.1 hypothetical protein [Pyxidicoccus fallax]